MSRWTLVALALFVLVAWGALRHADPLATKLPFGTTDLSSVSEALGKLDPADRQRVEAYVQRTNGDYLPAGMGDPDDPTDARTFAEAIERQKQFEARMAVEEARAAERKAERDVRWKPLRAALGMKMVRREMLSGAQLNTWGDPAGPQAVTTFRLTNTGRETITEFDVKIDVRKRHYPPTEFGILVDCWIEKRERLLPGESVDVRCGRRRSLSTVTDPDFLAWPVADMDQRWEPRRIRFDSGRELEFRE